MDLKEILPEFQRFLQDRRLAPENDNTVPARRVSMDNEALRGLGYAGVPGGTSK